METGSQLPVFRKRLVILHNRKKCGNVLAIFPIAGFSSVRNLTVAAFSHKKANIGVVADLEKIFSNISDLLRPACHSFVITWDTMMRPPCGSGRKLKSHWRNRWIFVATRQQWRQCLPDFLRAYSLDQAVSTDPALNVAFSKSGGMFA